MFEIDIDIEKLKSAFGEVSFLGNHKDMCAHIVTLLQKKGLKVSTAESCTGGYLSKMITDVPGVSDVFECGICTYSNRIKHKLLGVPEDLFVRFGAVSDEVATKMAEGVRGVAGADIGIGITGVAGPGGGTAEKPVGLVYVSVASDKLNFTKKLMLGDICKNRDEIRYAVCIYALSLIIKSAEMY